MRKYDKVFYIKEDLRTFQINDIFLFNWGKDMDKMALPKWVD